jgi:hypothetical protein
MEGATAELRAARVDVRWLQSVGLMEEETYFCLFSAGALADVVAANERSGLGCERIAEVAIARAGDLGN